MKKTAFITLIIAAIMACSESIPPEEKLFETARNYEAAQDFNNAIATYDLIIKNYPQSPNRYKAIFMKGYIYTDILKDRNKALETMDTLLAQYPDCDLADDAKILREIAVRGVDLMSVFKDSTQTK